MKALQDGPHVVVGTPGRVQDMIQVTVIRISSTGDVLTTFQRRHLKTDSMKMFVLDEADEMLSVGSPVHNAQIFPNIHSVGLPSRSTTSFSFFLNRLKSYFYQLLCPKTSLKSLQSSCATRSGFWCKLGGSFYRLERILF